MKDLQAITQEIPNILQDALQQAIRDLNLSGVEGRLIIWKLRYTAEYTCWAGFKLVKGKLYWKCGIKINGTEYELDEAIRLSDEDSLETLRERISWVMTFKLRFGIETIFNELKAL